MKHLALTLLSALTAISLVTSAKAAPCFALTDANHLLIFDSATPGTVTDQTITNLGGYDTESLTMRTTTQTVGAANPGVGSLWALGNNGTNFQLFIITPSTTPTTATATPIGSPLLSMTPAIAALAFGAGGFAFNPATDRFEAVSVNFNFEIDPNTLTAVRKPDVFTAGSTFPAFASPAFTPASFGATSRFYIVNTGENHNLCTSANISAGGLISEAGATQFGTATMFSHPDGLSISDGNFTLLGASDQKLYNVTLSTGVASLIGTIAGGVQVRSVIIVPASFPPVLKATVIIKGKKKVMTTASRLLIKGTASSEAGIKLVQYKIGKAKFKTAKGTTHWKFTAKLKPGLNKITVQATGGNQVVSAPKKIKVIRVFLED